MARFKTKNDHVTKKRKLKIGRTFHKCTKHAVCGDLNKTEALRPAHYMERWARSFIF